MHSKKDGLNNTKESFDNGGEVIISNNKLLFRGANNRITVIGTIRVVKGEKRIYKSPFAKAFIKENTDELVDNWAKENGYKVWKEDFGNSYEGGGSTKPNPTKNMNHDNLMNRSDFTAYVNINDYPYTATVRNLNSFRNYLNRKDEKFTPNVFGEITYISDNASDEWVYQLQNLIDEKKYELRTYNNGGMTKNEHILESFLTSNKNAKVNNLSTHYAENENQILLRNYGTLIAIRRGNDVEITSKKYSVTTSKIQNALERMAKSLTMNVSRVDGFEAGGQLDSVSDMLPQSEPMGIIQPMNIMETVQPMYDGGGYIVQDSWRKSGIGNLSLEETKKVAKKFAEALSIASNDTFAVNKKTIEPNSFDLDMNDGDGLESYEYDGGSYNIYGDGSVVNVAVSPSARYGSVDNTVDEIVAKLKDLQKQFDNAEWKDKKNFEGKVYTQELVTEIKYAGGGGVNDDIKKRYEEYRKREIAKQEEEEKGKTFKTYIVNVYEQKKSGGYPFTSHETDNFLEAVDFGKAKMTQQRRYRSESDPLWVSISKFVPIRKRANVFYAYNDLIHYNEKDMEYFKNSFDAGGQTNFEIEKDDSDYSDNFYKMLEEQRQQELIIQMKIATIMGIDSAIRLKDSDFVIHPFNLIQSAVRKGFIDVEQINKALIDASENEAYHIDNTYRDSGHGIGGSDMNAFIRSMLQSAGIQEKDYENGGMTQGYNDRMDESLGMRHKGHHSQTHKDRRDEAKGMNKGMGNRAYQSVGTMDRMDDGGQLFDDLKIKKGAFTEEAQKRGLSTEVFMKKVLANPSRYDERLRKQAQLMKNMMRNGGMTQGYNDRMDESLGMRHKGYHSQTHKDRRDEAKGMNKGMGNRAYQSVGTMDKMETGGEIYKKGDTVLLQDGTTQKTAIVVADGIDGKNRVRVRPQGFPMDMSISTIQNDRLYIIKKMAKGGALKPIPEGNKGLPKLPKDVRNRMGYMEYGGVAEKRQQAEAERQMKRTVLNDTTHKLINKNGSDINKYSAYDLKTLKSYISERDISEKMAQNVWGLAIQNGFEGYRSKVLILNSGTGNILNFVDDEFNRVDAVNPDKTENIIAGLLNDEESIHIHTDSIKTLNKYDLAIILDVDNQIINGSKRDSLKLVTNKLNPNNLLIFVTIDIGIDHKKGERGVKMLSTKTGDNANTEYLNNNYRIKSAFNDGTRMISVLKRL